MYSSPNELRKTKRLPLQGETMATYGCLAWRSSAGPAARKDVTQTPMKENAPVTERSYTGLLTAVVELLEEARRASARSVNKIMTATYWEIGRRIVEQEQHGRKRADYGEALIERLSSDLTVRFGRGFSRSNLWQMRDFYSAWPILRAQPAESRSGLLDSQRLGILHTVSGEWGDTKAAAQEPKKLQTLSGQSRGADIGLDFPLPWSHYVRLLSVKNVQARRFYEAEALRGGWSVRQLDRQVSSLFYERTALSRNKAAMLKKGQNAIPEDSVTPEEEVKDPLVLEFLGLKDEYSENDLEEALICHLEKFLLELGNDFTFVSRQKRLRVEDDWYRIDLLFFHRRLRCLIIIDLKIGRFTHADAGQMNLYVNYAREHWMLDHENPPVGLILCSQKNEAAAHYALANLTNKVLASEYRLTLPSEKQLAEEIARTRRTLIESRPAATPEESRS
jgi:predicted nuclease of restriction endonuclease-like (RecB) superfamily